MISQILITVFSMVFMEAFAWFSHKYIMHGFMWRWHQSHHSNEKRIFEKNDLFGIIFGVFSFIFILIGSTNSSLNYLFWIGLGILFYGIFYFIFHDIIVHQRIKLPIKIKNSYLKRIVKAHHIHHKTHSQEGAEAFGFLYANKKYASKR
jgi:beta-carotene 3-hydroxylase